VNYLVVIKEKRDVIATSRPKSRDVTTPSRLTNLANSDFSWLKLAENRRNRPRTWLRAGGGER
jgi:hypothetical protein